MNMKTIISITAAALLLVGFNPSEAVAKPKYKQRHSYKKNYKKHYKHHGKHKNHHKSHYKQKVYHYDYHYNKPYKIKYDRPDYDSESFYIYGTPGGGIGFGYSEINNAPYPPFYGYY